MDKSWRSHAARAAVFLIFVGYVYSVRFAPHRDSPFEDAETTVRASNAGYPFQLLYVSSDGAPPVVRRMSEVYGDFGIHIVLSLTGSAGRALFGPSFQLRTQAARVILFMLFVITAAAMLATPVPLQVGIAGVVGLWALLFWGVLNLTEARFWGVAYAAVICSVYIGTVLNAWTRPRIAALVSIALLAAYAQLLRQEAAPTAYVVGLALLAAAGITWLAGRWDRGTDTMAHSFVIARRALAGGLLLILTNAAVVPIERWCFAMAWGKPFRETAPARHGAGWPLYLSLGYVSNPYNIAWRDSIGQVHAALIQPGLQLDRPDFQPALLREYERIVIERPWLFVQNTLARARRVHELASQPSGGTTVAQTRPLADAYRAAPWVMLVSLGLLAWRGTPAAAVCWFSMIALAAGASAGALLVFPEYLGGLQGSVVAVLFVVPAVVAGSLAESMRPGGPLPHLTRRVLGVYALFLLVCTGIGAMFVGVQARRYRDVQTATIASDPVSAISTQQFRYAHVFNDLPAASQGRLVARLAASTDRSVAAHVQELEGDLDLFRPQLLARTASQIHVIAWMGRGFVPPVPRLFQGATHASLLVCGDCPERTSVNDIQTGLRWTMIGDLEWQGRYRMFSFAVTPALKRAAVFRVAAERTTALDYTRPTWLVPELISRATVSF